MDLDGTAYKNQEEMAKASVELSELRAKQFSNNRLSREGETNNFDILDPSPGKEPSRSAFNQADLKRVRKISSEMQVAMGLYSKDLIQFDSYETYGVYLQGSTPPNEPDKALPRSEHSPILGRMPGKFSFAVWGKVFSPGNNTSTDLVYDSAENHTARALEIALAMRGDWEADSWLEVGNALHKAHATGWATLPAEPELGRNFVCIRFILGEGALPTVLNLQDPPEWPKKWPHRLAEPFSEAIHNNNIIHKPNRGQCDVPAGETFTQVAGGNFHSIGLRADGTAIAWGKNDCGECDVPDGERFTQVAVGNGHSIGLRADGTAVAWGEARSGACDVPAGERFTQVVACYELSIGLRADGTTIAWGFYEY
jgi:hypothetical protein